MKGNKYKIIVLTLFIFCLSAIPAYALSITAVSKFTSTGAYIGGYSYTANSGYHDVSVTSYLSVDGTILDIVYDADPSWAQADVGANSVPGTQTRYWHIQGDSYGYLNGDYTYKVSTANYNEYY